MFYHGNQVSYDFLLNVDNLAIYCSTKRTGVAGSAILITCK